MAVDVIKFVDSIAASPTVRLDVNDGSVWRCGRFNAAPPRLRRAQSSNAMTDGGFVSSSVYEMRTLTLELALVHSSEDNAATEWQKLARELDRAENFLMYQPTGATKPVFFRTFRSDIPALEQFTGGAQAFKKPTVEILAEPFALGLRETLGPFTVNNDPAAGSNGLFVDVTGVIGDVAAPPLVRIAGPSNKAGVLAVRRRGAPSGLVAIKQAESMTLGSDTANPGGGPDAAMSGTGTNNFVRTSFTPNPPTMNTRLTWPPASSVENAGRYRVMVCVRRSDATSVFTTRLAGLPGTSSVGTTITIPATTSRILLDLGSIDTSSYGLQRGAGGIAAPASEMTFGIQAARDSGTGTLDWDFVALVPADEAQMVWSGASVAADLLLDGSNGLVVDDESSPEAIPYSGSIPSLLPNVTNRWFLLTTSLTSVMTKTDSAAVTFDYWPRYLYVRPAAS